MKITFALAVALWGASVAATQPKYVITDIGKVDPTTDTVPEGGINNNGEIAGWASRGGTPFFLRAFRTPPNGTLSPASDLGTLGGEYSYATKINDLGQVTGYSYTGPGFTNERAFRTVAGASAMTAADNLGTLGAGGSSGFGINNLGQVVGVSRRAFSPIPAGFRTAPNQPINPATDDLGSLTGPTGHCFALAINDLGQAVGFSAIGGPVLRAFRTAPNQPINPATDDLGTFGGAASTAKAINNRGQVVGWAQFPDGSRRAFRTAANAPITSGDNLGSFGGDSFAFSINNAGDVVGIANTAEGVLKAFLYKDGELYDLNESIPGGTPWIRLAGAYGINDAGQITGYGFVTGDPLPRGFRLDPPGIALAGLESRVDSSSLAGGEREALSASLEAARDSLEKGNENAAANQLQAFIHKVEAMRDSGRIDGATADSWIAAAQMLVAAMS